MHGHDYLLLLFVYISMWHLILWLSRVNLPKRMIKFGLFNGFSSLNVDMLEQVIFR